MTQFFKWPYGNPETPKAGQGKHEAQSSYSQSTGVSNQRDHSSKKKQKVAITPSVASRQPEMYATEALQGGDASRKDARRVGRRVESWFDLSCVE